nr:MAG TPA: hypothetical protein [Caudoviricetes sp.]
MYAFFLIYLPNNNNAIFFINLLINFVPLRQSDWRRRASCRGYDVL